MSDRLRRLHILIVDNDESFLKSCIDLLATLGIKMVSTAQGCEEAFTKCESASDPIDVILAGVNLRDGNGLQLLKNLRLGRLPKLSSRTCFILLTTTTSTSLILTAGALDCTGYLLKPISASGLSNAIRDGFEKRIVTDNATYENVLIADSVC